MKDTGHAETLWNEEIRRCGVVDIAEKVREARLRRYGHIIRRHEGELVKDIWSRIYKGTEYSRDQRRNGPCQRRKKTVI
jgi:precorrin-4 methylase